METGAIGHRPNLGGGVTVDETPPPPILTEVLDPDPPEMAPSTLEQTATGDYEWYTP